MSARDDYPFLVQLAKRYSRSPADRQITAALNEIDNLRRLSAEADEVIAGWERVYEACGSPGPLGGYKYDNVLRVIEEAIL